MHNHVRENQRQGKKAKEANLGKCKRNSANDKHHNFIFENPHEIGVDKENNEQAEKLEQMYYFKLRKGNYSTQNNYAHYINECY